jgi:hypothetical protein
MCANYSSCPSRYLEIEGFARRIPPPHPQVFTSVSPDSRRHVNLTNNALRFLLP